MSAQALLSVIAPVVAVAPQATGAADASAAFEGLLAAMAGSTVAADEAAASGEPKPETDDGQDAAPPTGAGFLSPPLTLLTPPPPTAEISVSAEEQPVLVRAAPVSPAETPEAPAAAPALPEDTAAAAPAASPAPAATAAAATPAPTAPASLTPVAPEHSTILSAEPPVVDGDSAIAADAALAADRAVKAALAAPASPPSTTPAPPVTPPAPPPLRPLAERTNRPLDGEGEAASAAGAVTTDAAAAAPVDAATAAAAPDATAKPADALAPPPIDLIVTSDEGQQSGQGDLQTTPQTAAHKAADMTGATLSRAAIDATAQIAAQILRRLEGRSTRFEMALMPDDLGRVDVKLDIDSEGRLAARLAFDNPAAATDLRGRADELRRQLEAQGFQIADDGFEFTQRDSGSHAFDRGQDQRQGQSRAFSNATRLNADADTIVQPRWTSLSLTPSGVDLKV